MGRNSKAKRDAKRKAAVLRGPTASRTPRPSQARITATRPSWLDACPACGADVGEEGPLGCCDAWTLTCEGAIDGKPHSWNDYPDLSDEQESEIIDRIEYHSWYEDTGEPAPANGEPFLCRCEAVGS